MSPRAHPLLRRLSPRILEARIKRAMTDPPNERPDAALFEAWAQGDRSAGSHLFDRHFRTVDRYFRNKLIGRPADAEDLVQRTFLRCIEIHHRFDPSSSFRAFLLGVGHNILREYFRRNARHNGRIDFGTVSLCDLAPGPSTIVAAGRVAQQLLDALRKIPLSDQTVLELFYWEGMSAREVGEVLECPEGTVRTRLRSARIRLSKALGQLNVPERPSLDRGDAAFDGWARAVFASGIG